jgi:hypothetical protein
MEDQDIRVGQPEVKFDSMCRKRVSRRKNIFQQQCWDLLATSQAFGMVSRRNHTVPECHQRLQIQYKTTPDAERGRIQQEPAIDHPLL